MEKLMVLRKKYYSFDKKGMVLPVRQDNGFYYVLALDIVLYNHYFMSDSEIKMCLINGIGFEWRYIDEDLTILNNKKSNLLKFRILQVKSIFRKKDR